MTHRRRRRRVVISDTAATHDSQSSGHDECADAHFVFGGGRRENEELVGKGDILTEWYVFHIAQRM